MARSRTRHDPSGDAEPEARAASAGLSRRRLCWGGGLAMLGLGALPGSILLGGCSDDDSDNADGAAPATDDLATGSVSAPVVYSSPTCGCCSNYVSYMRSNGYDVEVQHPDDLDGIKASAGIPEEAQGCHTMMMGDYVVEGHVPIEAIDQLLNDRPAIDAIALPDMPAGSPGMSGAKEGMFEILAIKDGAVTEPYMML